MIDTTFRALISSFRNFAADRSGQASSTSSWSRRLIAYHLMMARATVLTSPKYMNGATLYDSESVRQTLPCVKLKEVDRNECPCVPESGCTFLKSVDPIPDPLADAIISVTLPIGNEEFDYVRWHEFEYRINSRIEAQRNSRMYTLRNISGKLHLYLYNRGSVDSVVLTGIFTNPVEAAMYSPCSPSEYACRPLDVPFVMDEEFKLVMFDIALNGIRSLKQFAAAADISNNTHDDTASNTLLK